MPSSNPIIVGGGIASGAPFTLGHLLYVSNVSPPQAASATNTIVAVDSVSGVQYVGYANSGGTFPSVTNATETVRILGGAIISGSGTDSVQVGRAANASQTDSIAIGRAAVANTVSTVVIGPGATNAGQQGVVIGSGASFSSAAGVVIGVNALATGNAGGASTVVVGAGARADCSPSGGGSAIAIGLNSRASAEDVIIGGNASSNQNSAFGVGSVVIGTSAIANISGGSVYAVVVGWSATTTQKLSTVLGSGASASGASQTRAIVIGSGASAAATDAIVIGGGSALTTKSIAIGAGATDLGAGVLQLGAAGTPITTVVFGAGNTAASPSPITLRFTNATGTDAAAGQLTITAPLSTGAATPAAIVFQTGVAGGSGSTLQTATPRLQIDTGGIYTDPSLAPTGAIAAYGASRSRILMFGSGTGPTATSIRQVGIGQALSYIGYRGNGTTATPTAVASGDRLANFGGGGFDGTNWIVSALANIAMFATENWTSSARGARIGFETTRNGTASSVAVAFIEQDGSLTLQPPAPSTVAISFGANAQRDAGGAGLGTLTNLPAAVTAGNPAVYLVFNVNGTPTYFPGWQ